MTPGASDHLIKQTRILYAQLALAKFTIVKQSLFEDFLGLVGIAIIFFSVYGSGPALLGAFLEDEMAKSIELIFLFLFWLLGLRGMARELLRFIRLRPQVRSFRKILDNENEPTGLDL